ncbi:MAG: penicillin-binding protein activator LpoB [Deltaproteobacteria bacterium]|nr:penicillin-binding protein activator LpoB [Deltaproteobacteria bacterium]MBN2672213.1 penicillin-binding protein activator LpoB [Deltaproteobacteria bacterium]
MRLLIVAACCAIGLAQLGCGANYVRGDEVDGLDNMAMSTGLDKVDLEKLFDENIDSLMASAVVAKWKEMPEPPLVSIFPIANETSEHIRDALDALLSKVETKLVNSGVALMIDHAQQDTLIAEIRKQQGGEFDQSKSAEVGRQLGAKFFITGKVHSTSEKVDGEKRVQYFLFMKVVDIETGAIRWQNEANLTKGLVK